MGAGRRGPLTLLTFGGLRLLDGSGQAVPYPERGLLAICYLSTSREFACSRAQLSRFLWGDSDPCRSAANLRKMFSRIAVRNAALGVEPFRLQGERVGLEPRALDCDLADMLAAGAGGRQPDPARVMALYRGEFLADVGVVDGESRFWLDQQRLRFSDMAIRALHGEADRAAAAGDVPRAKDAALRILEIDPRDETAYRRLIGLLSSEGRFAEARDLLTRCRNRLRDDLGAVPEAATVEAARSPEATGRHASVASRMEGPADNFRQWRDRQGVPRLVLLDGCHAASTTLIEDVTIGLCQSRSVAVVAPHTARGVSRPNVSADALRRLAVDYVLDTRTRRSGGDATLSVRLVHAWTSEVVWADRMALAPGDLAASYRRTIARIVATVAGEIGARELGRCRTDRDPSAYHSYLEGMRHLRRIDLPDVRRARRAFRASLQQNAGFAPARSGLSRTYHLEWLLTARGDAALLREATDSANEAIAADADDPSGHRELGVASLFMGGFDESVEAFERAEAIAPQHADLLADHADTLVHSARPAEALAKIEQAIELNPLAPDIYLWTAAGASFFLERYEDALGLMRRMKDPKPAARLASACHALRGDPRSARSSAAAVKLTYPDFDVDAWLAVLPFKEPWQRNHYREGLRGAGL